MLRIARGYILGGCGAIVCVLVLLPFREKLNSTPVALAFLLAVLFTAAGYGRGPGVVLSFVSMLCLNFFFLPPYHTLAIADPQNWMALGAFLITSLIAGGLSASAKVRAEEAEKKKKEIEHLYAQLKEMFAKASEAEAMKQSEQLKSALLDAVSHDLRTPLTSMKAAVTTLLAGSSDPQGFTMDEEGRGEMLEVIDTEIDRLNHLLEGLIEIAKIESGAMQPRRAWTNVEEIVSISLTRAAGIASHHRLKMEVDDDLPPVRVDEKAITEVLYLLLENATKYSPSGSEIRLSVKPTRENSIQFSIEDQGIGVPEEVREKVFDKFFRAVDKHRQVPSGLGMGLSIARALVEAHEGRIWIEDSTSGSGARVAFTIPLVAS